MCSTSGASWCIGCRHEHGALLEIARRGEVPIVGLNWNDDREKALTWLQQLGNPYAVNAFDGEGRVAHRLGRIRRTGNLPGRRRRQDHEETCLADHGADLGTGIRAAAGEGQGAIAMKPLWLALIVSVVTLFGSQAFAIDHAPAFDDPATAGAL